MQDNIMNLLNYILNNCNVLHEDKPEQKEKWVEVFKDNKLLRSLIVGLETSDSFERQKFIKFIKMYVPYIKYFAYKNSSFQDDLKEQYNELMDCLIGLLKRVDLQIVSIID